MRLLVSGLVGVLVACLIFTATVVLVPQHVPPRVLLSVSVGDGELWRLEGPKGVAYCQPALKPPPFVLNVTLYEFTKPLGVGSEADLTITLTSKLNASETYFVAGWIGALFLESGSVKLPERGVKPGGISFINESSRWVWIGNVEPNGSKTFNLRIKAIEVGIVHLEMVAAIMDEYFSWDREYIFPIEGGHERISMLFTILRNDVLVYPLDLPLIMQDGEWRYPTRVIPRMSFIPPGMPPYALGTEFNVTIVIEPYIGNATDATMRFVVEEGIVLVEGDALWTGNVTIKPYREVQLSMKIKFVKVGTWYMYCYAEKDGLIIGAPEMLQFIVSNDDITWSGR